MQILQIDASALGQNSASRELGDLIVQRLRTEQPRAVVVRRDLDAEPIPHLTARSLAGSDPAETRLAERVLAEFQAADVIVIGAPMYNFSIPSTLKAWIDRIAVAGKTFRYTATGPQGLAGGKRAIIALATGGTTAPGQPGEHVETYLRHLLGFLGIDQIEVVAARGLNLSPESRAQSLSAARAEINQALSRAA